MKGLIASLKQLAKLSPIALSKNHLYDKQTQRIIRSVLTADSCCIDVGCHKGEILDLMLHAAPEGIHYGFEPIPQFYNELVKKYSGYPNVLIHNVAASDVKETSKFNFVSSNPSYSGLKKRKYDRADEVDEQIEVIVDRIDDVIPKDLKIDLIKIDVEGAELLVLKGAVELIRRCRPVIVFEHGLGAADVYGATPGKVFDVLNDAELSISTMGAYLAGKSPLTKVEFERQYNDRVNYYFIAC